MDRRKFIKTAAASAAVSSLPTFSATAATASERWRVYEVTTRVEVLKPAGVTRVWLPLPLTKDTDYQKNLGNTWGVEGGTVETAVDGKYGAEFLQAEWPDGAVGPVVQVTNRFATRDRATDFSKRGTPGRADRAELQRYVHATDLMPTTGIVRDTARMITKDVKGGTIDKGRAVYEWIVENTFRDPKTPGCGVGDIKTMLETQNLGGKCADLNALFVGLARCDRRAGARRLRRARGQIGIRLSQPRRGHRQHHQGAALPRRVLRRQATAGYRSIRRTCAKSCSRKKAAARCCRSTTRRSRPRARGCSADGK